MWPALRPQHDTARNETGKIFDFEELTRYRGWSDSGQVNRHDDFSLLGQCPEETKPPSREGQGALAVGAIQEGKPRVALGSHLCAWQT